MKLDGGTITIDGVDLQTLPHEYVRTHIVALPQDSYIFDGTLRLNVDPGRTATDERIIEVLKQVRLWSKIEARGGLENVIGDDFFSPGESQVLVFARALLRDSKILILDEFTSRYVIGPGRSEMHRPPWICRISYLPDCCRSY